MERGEWRVRRAATDRDRRGRGATCGNEGNTGRCDEGGGWAEGPAPAGASENPWG